MAAGDNPFMVSGGRITWEKEATAGTAPASGAWNTFGPRVGDFRDPGPTNTWMQQRSWNSGRIPYSKDLLAQDYGPTPIGVFKLQDMRMPGFAFGQEVSAPVALGGGFYRHLVSFTTNSTFDGLAMSMQVADGDSAGNTTRTTYTYGVMPEVALNFDEGAEVTYEPTTLFQKEDTTVALNTVSEPTTATPKHFHGYLEAYGQQILRVVSARARIVNTINPARYWNSTNARYAYEYPFEDATVFLSARCIADGRQFSSFSSRDITGLLRNGDISRGVLRAARTVDQDEGKLVIGTTDDALALISAPRVRPAAGGRIYYDIEFSCRTATWQYVDTTSTRYFPS